MPGLEYMHSPKFEFMSRVKMLGQFLCINWVLDGYFQAYGSTWSVLKFIIITEQRKITQAEIKYRNTCYHGNIISGFPFHKN